MEGKTNHKFEYSSSPASIHVENVSVFYGKKAALDKVTIEIPPGTQIAVVGPNGAGKSTLFKVLVGLIKPDSGSVKIHELPIGTFKACVAYVPQREEVDLHFPITVKEVVMMGRYSHYGMMGKPDSQDYDAVSSAIEKLGIADITKNSLSELSGGQLQRVFLARAIAQEPHILIMDEPFNGVDVSTQEATFQLLSSLRDQNVTVLVSTHDLNMASDRFDSIILLNHKLIAYGTSENVMKKDILALAFGGQMYMLDGAIVVDHCCPHEDESEEL